MRYSIFILVSLLFLSCNKADETPSIPSESIAKPIYNQAYQDNYEADNISDILANARYAYVLIDPFEEDVSSFIPAIKAHNNEVGAYISIGTAETFRDDFNALQAFLVSTPWEEWPNEYFVNSTTTGILEIMKARIDQIALWDCDWVEFDNMDWIFDQELRNRYGFEVTEAEGIAYYNELCDYVHQKGMKCMAKNTTESASNFDGVLYESYPNEKNWWNQQEAKEFLDQAKLVIVNHYNENNCAEVYSDYKGIYNKKLSYICEDKDLGKYVHFNE
ncbi:endo alpha-1,4 polygalactosaminidase [Mesonia sp.]|uniref:endo alpha-1,4 polygalactosaminidase n=1 Tax=Mesonia sp. TaxID=1960830 RepID=UPI003F96CD36